MFRVHDEMHDEWMSEDLATYDDALNEIKRLAALPWDAPENRTPCTNPECGRSYHIVEFHPPGSEPPFTEYNILVEINPSGAEWRDPAGPNKRIQQTRQTLD